jgi:phosphoribosylanthranilate isomerase
MPPSRIKIKICGQTSLADCEMSVRHGADYLGVVLDVRWSARSLDVEAAEPIFRKYGPRTFLLLFNRSPDDGILDAVRFLKPYAIQLTGKETPETAGAIQRAAGVPVFKSIHLPPVGEGEADAGSLIAMMKEYDEAGVDGFVLDTSSGGMYGGTGKRSDWTTAAEVVRHAPLPVFLAGGINPDNVAEAVRVPGIYGVDLASGVEEAKGKKSEEKVKRLIQEIRLAQKQEVKR